MSHLVTILPVAFSQFGRRILMALALSAGVLLPTPARADTQKAGVFILGIQLGNANGVSWGLMNSYDPSKAAHPNGIPLIRQQLQSAIGSAKNLQLPTADIEKLVRDLDRLPFAAINTRVKTLLATSSTALAGKYGPGAPRVFDLGVQLTFAGGILRLGQDSRPQDQPARRAQAAAMGPAMAATITSNKLEATLSLTDTYTKRVSGGEDLGSLLTFTGTMMNQWIQDFLRAPAWGVAGGLLNTRWSGSETLKAYGKLTFQFGPNGKASMIDRDGNESGTWTQSGNQVTLKFYNGNVTYRGTINGTTISGTASNPRTTWTFAINRQ